MAKADFLKSWVVDSATPVVASESPKPTFCILDDREDNVLIRYCCFGRQFPSIQNGFYDKREKVIVAVTEGMKLMAFKISDGGELVTQLPQTCSFFLSKVMPPGPGQPQSTTLTRNDYLGRWVVRRAPERSFCIYPDPVDPMNKRSVIIHYSHFDSAYPTFQNGYFDFDSESIVGMMPKYRRLRLHLEGKLLKAVAYKGVEGGLRGGEPRWRAKKVDS